MYNTQYAATPMMFDCLHYYVRDNIVMIDYIQSTNTRQIITYCLRPYSLTSIYPHIAPQEIQRISFDDLRHMSVTSQQLYKWSVPIDLVEDYQWYLDTNSSKSHLFYNCTRPWFGPSCRYAFEFDAAMSLDLIVKSIFLGKGNSQQPPPLDVLEYTCYTFIQCTRSSSLCLDWREVCDGSIDCDEGTDEADCWQLEITECSSDQYRCHNGAQCIHINFQNDDTLNAECLDSSDEDKSQELIETYSKYCLNDPSFRCEERMCPSRGITFHPFACGDGQCVNHHPACCNSRDNRLLRGILEKSYYTMPDECVKRSTCFTNLMKPTLDELCNDYYQRYCLSTHSCWDGMKGYCPATYDFPVGLSLFGHVHFRYGSNQIYNKVAITSPYGLCYNESRCHRSVLPFTTNSNYFNINGSTLSCFTRPGSSTRWKKSEKNDLLKSFALFILSSIQYKENNFQSYILPSCYFVLLLKLMSF